MQGKHLRRLVEHYRQNVYLDDHLAFYRNLSTLEEAIDYAALAKLPNGKRHPHQRRLQRQTLETVKQNLLSNKIQLEQSELFEDIFHLIQACAVHGFGELARYDTALRLAVHLDLLPTCVYLHAGTRKGAAALSLNVDREHIALAELPQPLQMLSPHQAEDFLCIYKDRFTELSKFDKITGRSCTPRAEEPIEHVSLCIGVQQC